MMAHPPARILFLTPQLPYPPRQGTSIRNFNLIGYLARSSRIDLVTFLAPGEALNDANPLNAACATIQTVREPARSGRDRLVDLFFTRQPDMGLRLASSEMFSLVNGLRLDEYDIIQFEGIEMAPYGIQIRNLIGQANIEPQRRPVLIFDDHNCEYLLQQRNALTDLRIPKRWPAAAYSLIQTQKLRGYERRACDSADLVVTVSGPDKMALAKLEISTPLVTIPNGIDVHAYSDLNANGRRERDTPPTIVFTGKMDYRPNIDAALWFGAKVFPAVQRVVPSAIFQIVGQHPHPRLDDLRRNAGIQITGAVAEIQPYLAHASLFVIPMRVGGGTRLKALEAMAAGLPIVTTSLGIEGISARDGRELLIRDDAADFAQAVLYLLNDQSEGSERSRELGAAARSFVADSYDWSHILPELERAYGALLAARPLTDGGGKGTM